jgi:hypothetical protein
MKVIAALLITLSVASAWKKCNRNRHFDAERNQLCCQHRIVGPLVYQSLSDASSPANPKMRSIYFCQCDPAQNDEIRAASNNQYECVGEQKKRGGGYRYYHIAPVSPSSKNANGDKDYQH